MQGGGSFGRDAGLFGLARGLSSREQLGTSTAGTFKLEVDGLVVRGEALTTLAREDARWGDGAARRRREGEVKALYAFP